ncbi:hypothetical protein M427DRAFT_60571 [Gonapodya prolifera JEL478]|uniref:Uncharacterized protein n=1 Tax=Gonapodya prolifera (strain JEL478) TaxID=1344416 RepID=A0A139A589_GONPJ|nr:hypothetical protein M427DRAFT_60571 [Gonapodya prolifera JEL478]|eukprot:KXS11553.1 hypothetical protein M427DRAFT_60571 [Gonapodya prolifera JEL478]
MRFTVSRTLPLLLALFSAVQLASGNPIAARNNGNGNGDWEEAIKAQKDARECVKRKGIVKAIYNQTLAVNNPLGILSGKIDISNLFHPDVRARVTPLGDFEGRAGVEEYFYGLGAGIVRIVFKKLLCDPSNGIVSAHVHLVSDQPPLYSNYTHVGYWQFNDTTGTVNSADVNFVMLGLLSNPTLADPTVYVQGACALATLGLGKNTSVPAGTCVKYQNDTKFVGNTPEEMYADCTKFLTSIDLGTWDAVNQNTTVCRFLHAQLTQFRPEVHCAHVGRTGGGKCVLHSWQDYYTKDF